MTFGKRDRRNLALHKKVLGLSTFSHFLALALSFLPTFCLQMPGGGVRRGCRRKGLRGEPSSSVRLQPWEKWWVFLFLFCSAGLGIVKVVGVS